LDSGALPVEPLALASRHEENNMKKISMLLTFALAACGAGSPDGGNSGTGAVTAEAGAVRGVAVDTQNRPLSGAEITVCSTPFYNSCINGATGTDGSYSLRLTSNNVWAATGSIIKSYNGATYCLPLAVDNSHSFSSTDATIRNFSWKLSGVVPGQMDNHSAGSYFGASLNTVFDMSLYRNQVRVNFVPNGPLIDGSAGSSFSAIAGDWVSNSIGNIPIGAYTVRAEYLQPGGGVMPLRVSLTSTTGNLGASVTVQFPPDPGSSCVIGPEARLYIAP
jgi:hypothetical protein